MWREMKIGHGYTQIPTDINGGIFFTKTLSVLICGLFDFLHDLHVLHGKKMFIYILQLRVLRALRGENGFHFDFQL